MLSTLQLGDGQNVGCRDGVIALDCSIRPTRQFPDWLYTISTTDFFFPLVDSPYLQGRIGAANVLSDLYAQGVPDCDFVLMLLAASRDMSEQERTIATHEMVRGFRDACQEAQTTVTGGQTVLNPWPIIGGVATTVVARNDFTRCNGAVAGNVIVLTKPLGTQVAVNVHQWRVEQERYWNKAVQDAGITSESAQTMFHTACTIMARLNRNGATLMRQHGATAATDVTGFGILGHAQNLSDNQDAAVGLALHRLPCIAGTLAVNDHVLNFRLRVGYSAETSGGLLVCLPSMDAAEAFVRDIQQLDQSPAWIVGTVVESETRQSYIAQDAEFLEV